MSLMTQQQAIVTASERLQGMMLAILKDHTIQQSVDETSMQSIVNVNILAQVIMLGERLDHLDQIQVPMVLCEFGTKPKYKNPGDAGADIYASPIDDDGNRVESLWLMPRSSLLVHSGFKVALPPGWRARIESRSGLSLNDKIEVGAGLIDNGYRGEVGVILYNHSDRPFLVERHDRIAQICIEKMTRADFVAVDELPESERGDSGWGSSGTKDVI